MLKRSLLVLMCLVSSALFAQGNMQELLDIQKAKEDTASSMANVNKAQLAMSNADYIVTAGDVYQLSFVAGSTPVSYSIPVDSTYKIRIANLAIVDAKGKTFVQLKKEVENIVVRNFSMSGVQFVLINPASFTVIVKGEVRDVVEKAAWSLTRVSELVKTSLTEYASLRNIQITSSEGEVKVVDLFIANRFGDLTQNPYVRPGDVITVNRMDRKVTLSGAVERPGVYELLPDENLKDLINYYGNGYSPLADPSRIELTRMTSDKSESGEKIYLNQQNVDENYLIKCYDNVTIYSYSNLRPVMFVEGAVVQTTGTTGTELMATNKLAIAYEYGENYAFLIRRYAGMFLSISDTENAYLVRKGEIIPMNLNLALYDASYYSDLTVEPNDVLRVPFRQFFVTVAGAVKNPGRFPYIPDRDYEYYIGLAGGFDKTKNKHSAVEILDINGDRLKTSEKILPEATITAKTNTFLYYFGQYAPFITTLLSAVSVSISVLAVTGAL